jgi:DNA-binding transcriptional LysR family regulator
MFKISLDALLVLDAVDRLGSFSAAANELFRVPSTISYTVSKLEQDLDVKIYNRLGPKVVLTSAGQTLLNEGRNLIKAAEDIENRVRRVATGWETELTIGMDTIFSPSSLVNEINDFYKVAPLTKLNFLHESLSGTWEALLDRRVDLLIGAAGEGPSGGGYKTKQIGTMDFVFVVSPNHSLATVQEPLGKAELAKHRAIAVSDSVRKLPPRSVGLLQGQEILAVPNMNTKLAFQIAGLGFGFIPTVMARDAIAQGQLIIKTVAEPRPAEVLHIAWRTADNGEGLKWWLNKMDTSDLADKLWHDATNNHNHIDIKTYPKD